MVATFFAFLNDSVTPEAAKRLYGLVGVGGVAGGAFGSTTVRSLIATVPTAWWLWICVGLGLLILIIASVSGRMVDRNPPVTAPTDAGPSDTAAAPQGNPATEGARLVFRSRYLLAIVGIVGLYEIVSAVMNFQFTSTVAHYLDGPAIGQQFATVFAITNVMSLCVQLFLTSLIMTRYGVGVALFVLPLATLATSVGFMVTPILLMGSLQNVVDNGFNYSINQSAKEALYVPLSSEVKYKAKAFIDMFVHRLAKAIAIAVSLGTTLVFKEFASIRWLSAFSVLIILIWLIAVRYAGRRFRQMTE
jgi:AAA family ATP:ADP antiporter